ncbi:unnamed protein product, partial [Polarella glacialis]
SFLQRAGSPPRRSSWSSVPSERSVHRRSSADAKDQVDKRPAWNDRFCLPEAEKPEKSLASKAKSTLEVKKAQKDQKKEKEEDEEKEEEGEEEEEVCTRQEEVAMGSTAAQGGSSASGFSFFAPQRSAVPSGPSGQAAASVGIRSARGSISPSSWRQASASPADRRRVQSPEARARVK